MTNTEIKKEVMRLAHSLKKLGYTVYTHKPYNHLTKKQKSYLAHHRHYFYVTNGSIILTIGLDRYEWYVSCIYIPTTENGSGCRLTDSYKWKLNKEEIVSYFENIKTETDLFRYNKNLDKSQVKFYYNTAAWLKAYWDKESINIL